ncbi:hypothetical protein HF325_000755 [Metschnikowia pulcherrima]|uniref:Charged multivesicular body protein 6 n=1 Tax=Metschnikowia pulcherrima TaxID=27326 RepID=A0A8H7GXL4_9ASCO|nr:hypothetical protein HF325_000755 [Metschnikowia pulcherrima]
MGNSPSQPKITAQDKAIFQLKRQRDNLKQYLKRINVVIDRQTTLAKQAVEQGKLDKAKIYLRLKKAAAEYCFKHNLESLIGTIEFKLIEKDVLYGLSQGNEVLKRLNLEMSVEKIDRVMDDLEEEKLKVDEVLDILGLGLTNAEEHEVEDELEALEREVTGKTATQNDAKDGVKGDEDKLDLPKVPESAPESADLANLSVPELDPLDSVREVPEEHTQQDPLAA